jgi:hypothetical protein
MKYLILAIISLFMVSCNSFENDIQKKPLGTWIIENQREIDSTTNSLIADFHKRNNTNGQNWIASTITINQHAPNILGKLASSAGDSTECIVLQISFYRDRNLKNRIMITASDSSCLTKLKFIDLKNDSTDNFTFGVDINPIIY